MAKRKFKADDLLSKAKHRGGWRDKLTEEQRQEFDRVVEIYLEHRDIQGWRVYVDFLSREMQFPGTVDNVRRRLKKAVEEARRGKEKA